MTCHVYQDRANKCIYLLPCNWSVQICLGEGREACGPVDAIWFKKTHPTEPLSASSWAGSQVLRSAAILAMPHGGKPWHQVVYVGGIQFRLNIWHGCVARRGKKKPKSSVVLIQQCLKVPFAKCILREELGEHHVPWLLDSPLTCCLQSARGWLAMFPATSITILIIHHPSSCIINIIRKGNNQHHH